MTSNPHGVGIGRKARLSTVLLVAFLALAAVVAGCGGGGGGSSTTPAVPAAITSGGTVSADKVVLKGVAINDNTVELQVLFGGPSTKPLAKFSFDLLFSNSAFVQVANHTDETTADVLQGQESLMVGSIVSNRINVGYVRLDHLSNTFASNQGTIVRIQLRTIGKGTTTVAFSNAVAYDENDQPNGVAYDGSSVTITQQ